MFFSLDQSCFTVVFLVQKPLCSGLLHNIVNHILLDSVNNYKAKVEKRIFNILRFF